MLDVCAVENRRHHHRIEHNKQWDRPEGSLGLACTHTPVNMAVCVCPRGNGRDPDGRAIFGRPEMGNGRRARSGRRLLCIYMVVRSVEGDDVRIVGVRWIYTRS